MNRVADKKRNDRKARDAGRSYSCPHDTVRRSRLVREWGQRPFPHQRAAPHRVKAAMPRSATQRASVFVATRKGIGFAGGLRRAAATRYCAAADCGSSRLQPPPAPDACAHRVGGATPSEGNDHSRRRLSCIPSRKAECAAMRDLIRGSLGRQARQTRRFRPRPSSGEQS